MTVNPENNHDPRAALASRVDALTKASERAFAVRAFATVSIVFLAAWLMVA